MDNEKQKAYLRALLDLRSKIDSRINNEITEGVLKGREDINSLKGSIEYILDEFVSFNS